MSSRPSNGQVQRPLSTTGTGGVAEAPCCEDHGQLAVRHASFPSTLDFEPPSQTFLTEPGPLDALLSEAVHEVTGLTPSLATGGGTSDARFIKDYCPVVEFGLLTATIHKADEHVAIADLEQLTAIYRRFIELYFETFGGLGAG